MTTIEVKNPQPVGVRKFSAEDRLTILRDAIQQLRQEEPTALRRLMRRARRRR